MLVRHDMMATTTTILLFCSYFIKLSLFFYFCVAYDETLGTTTAVSSNNNDDGLDHLHYFPRSAEVNAIYQFGDSFSDTGNIKLIDPSNNCGKPPYGQAFLPHPTATGRCSDGLLLVDYFAKLLNVPLLDAYLNKDGNFSHGANFAVAGATALNASVLEKTYNIPLTSNFSLPLQLSWFRSHLLSFYPHVSERRRKLAKSIIFLGEVGSNDYNYAFFERRPFPTVYKMVPVVIEAIRNAVEEMIDLGATKIAIPGNFPIGCLPVYLSLFKANDSRMYDEFKCLKKYNRHSRYHNFRLQQTITDLQTVHPNVSIVYMDNFGAFKSVFQHARLFGFNKTVIEAACCGGGDNEYNVNIGATCGSNGTRVCINPQQHISWDGVHFTQRAHQVMANRLIPPLLGALHKNN